LLAPSEFDGIRAAGYLDTATYGLPPRATVEAARRAVDDWVDRRSWLDWEAEGEACRSLFAQLVGARTEQIAIVSALSVAAGVVAASVERGNVVVYKRDFHSNLIPWLLLEQRGIEVRLAPLERLVDACDDETAVVAVSAVQSADGQVADLARLKATGARVFVDATQAVTAVPLDLAHVDFLAASAYKWLCCPRGLCFFYVREPLSVHPILAGWKSLPDPYGDYYGPPGELTSDARRLDVSLAWHVAAGARPSLELLLRLGADRIAAHDLALARRFCAELGLADPASPIVRVEVEDVEAASSGSSAQASAAPAAPEHSVSPSTSTTARPTSTSRSRDSGTWFSPQRRKL
jgi:selenocysteine lyase/cysteine desulfurase